MLSKINNVISSVILSLYCSYFFRDKEIRKLKKMKVLLLVDMYYNKEINKEELTKSIKFQLGLR